MKNCVYTYKNESRVSYQRLMEILKENPQDAYDILYSKDYNVQSRVIDKLLELKLLGKVKKKSNITNSTDVFGGSAEVCINDYSLLGFINSGKYVNKAGESIMKIIDIDEYINRQRLLYESKGLSKEEVDNNCNILKLSWKRIAQDGSDFHKIILNIDNRTSYSEVVDLTKDTSFAHLSDKIYDGIEKQIYKEVKKKHGLESKEYNDASSPHLIKNINLTARLNNSKESITGHIDYIIINPDGSLDVFNIKSSHEPHSFWDNAKKEEYKNEFALLARMLLYNGISIKDIRFNVIPVVFDYNDTYTEVTDIHVNRFECYSHNKGAFVMYDHLRNAQQYIDSKIDSPEINVESIENINKQLNTIFPELGIKAKGIKTTIKNYINENWKYWVRGPQPDEGYSLYINGEHYDVKDPREGSDNEEVFKIIQENSEDLLDNYTGELSASSLINQIKLFRRTEFYNFDNYYLNQFFAPYFEHITVKEDGKDKYDYSWSIIENDVLNEANVIVFKNKSGQIDIIALSNLDINQKIQLNNRDNILGYHLSDAKASDHLGHELLRATYGNIEMMRALVILNEIIPKLSSDIKLGNVAVLGGLGTEIKGQSYPIQMVVPNFVKALDVAFENGDIKINNNIANSENMSPVELLINEYWNLMESNDSLKNSDFGSLKTLISGSETDAKLHLLNGVIEDSLASAETNEIRIQKLEELILKLNTILHNLNGISLDPDSLIKLSQPTNNNSLVRNCSKLLLTASVTLDRLSGIIRLSLSDLNNFDEILARPLNIANNQVRIVGKLLQDAIHNTSFKLDLEVSDFNMLCLEYYLKKGYTAFLNAIIGNLVEVFNHLYKEDMDDWILKNPYDLTEDLDDDDRKFLKRVLFIFNKIRFLDKTFPYKDENDPSLEAFINENSERYFLLPLERASKASRWRNPIKYGLDFERRAVNYCKHPELFFRELYEGVLTDTEEEQISLDIRDMLAYNPFKASNTLKGRKRIYKDHDLDYFETNLLNLVIDYIHRDIQEKEMNKMLIRTKGILLYLKLSGDRDNDPTKFDEIIKYIDDYLQVSVFNRSIMNKDTKKVEAKLRPIRKLVTKAYIALNPVAAIRDIISGFLSNNLRALSKYRTNMDVKDVLWGYLFVIGKGVHTAMDIDFLDKLNTKYLISNINIESPQEGYKTNRGGIRNMSNWLYVTLRKPDFLNRMVAFMGLLKHDGSYKAYSVIDGKLVYNWRMDKRFNLLASEDKSDMDAYNKLKSLYLSLLVLFNKENPDLNLKVGLDTDLPDGYTQSLVDNIKNFADTIYGSYNISTRAKYENMFAGSQLAAFSTWMNGIYDVYFGRRRESSYETTLVQARDEKGNLLWINETTGNITTLNTGIPYYTDIPLMVLGVFKTLLDISGIVLHSQSFNGAYLEFKLEILNNPMQLRNLRRLLTDLIVWYLMYQIFENGVKPLYTDHKKNGDGTELFENAVIEILYKGASSSYEEFKGPFPILDYITNNTKPATWLWSLRVVKDVWDLTFGDDTIGDFVMGAQAFPRSFLDSYKMYVRDTKNGIE